MPPLTLLATLAVPLATAAPAAERVPLHLTLFEAPQMVAPAGWPSMSASADLAASVDRAVVLGLQTAWFEAFPENEGLRTGLGMASVGAASFGLFLVNGWAHEEWHRAVMRHRDISSRNGIYHPEAWSSGTISVDHVLDEDLARLKAQHPAETVRLMSSGMEAEQAIVDRLADDLFWHDQVGTWRGPLYFGESWMSPPLLVGELSPLLYDLRCASEASDEVTDVENQLRLTVESRDFTGLDCTAWVYDMRRPDEPYGDRGPHPYGEGVDRYRSWEDLTGDEQAWLEQQVLLGLLNFANPHLFGVNAFGDADRRFMARLSQTATPWGHEIAVVAATRGHGAGLEATLHNGFAQAGWFPGLDLAVVDLPVSGEALHAEVGVGLWLQPEAQRWDRARRAPGGRLDVDLSWRLSPGFALTAGGMAKSRGWVLGEESLDPAASGRVGLTGWLPGPG